MKVVKRAFTLLEVSVSLLLASFLIIFLLQFYSSAHLLEKKIDSQRQIVLQRSFFETRLTQALSEVPKIKAFYPDTYFFQVEAAPDKKWPSLSFVFDNGLDPSPYFSGPINAKLALEEDLLMLYTWPLSKMNKMPLRKEVLMTDVSSISYTFFSQSENEYVWEKIWEDEENIPSMIKIFLTQKSSPLTFVFFLPVRNSEITYGIKK